MFLSALVAGISPRKKTHNSLKPPSGLSREIASFCVKALREKKRASYGLCDLPIMDQTPLPFILVDYKTDYRL